MSCRSADFAFAPDGDVADVVDRSFSGKTVSTVADIKRTPSMFVIAWDRTFTTMVGPQLVQHRYLINRTTGRAGVHTVDTVANITPSVYDTEEDCAIEG